MPSRPSVRSSVWLLPIVLIVCALMVLPTSLAFRSPPGRSSSGAAADVQHPVTPAANPAGIQWPSTYPTNLPSFASKPLSDFLVPGSSAETSWLTSVLHHEAASKKPPLVSLPNLEMLEHPQPSVGATVFPSYQTQPAPMGLADYGLGTNGAYSYNTSHIESQIVFNTPPNATAPGSEGTIDPQGQHIGNVGSPYEFSIQLNTVTDNMTIPGSNDGSFWTQNVLDMNDTSLHFVDDVFNFTSNVTSFNFGSVASGCGSNVNDILSAYGGVYQCVGGTVPISPADFPLTIQLYNNASVNSLNQSQVTFGYRFMGAGGFLQTGISDAVAFVNPNATAPVHVADFGIDGFSSTPSGELRDAEIILGGPIGGSNAVFNSLNGTMNLLYSNVTSGGWKNVPSAYNFGTDTGETSTGIAGFWTPSHTEEINQGPSLLYGLWNGLHWASVASGDIEFKGSITPAYGFVFVGNIAPGTLGQNLSIVPTNAAGSFNTYLPPSVPPSTQYFVRSFADAFAELNSTPFSTSQTGYNITLVSAPGLIRAPLYMNGNAQAKSLAQNVTGASTAPYVFSGLTVSLDLPFNYLNDYAFPSFTVFQEQGVSTAVTVNKVVQGPNLLGNTYYWYDVAHANGFLSPGPSILGSFPYLSDQFNVFDSANAHVSNESLFGNSAYSLPTPPAFPPVGGVVFLWHDTGASVMDIDALNYSEGVFVGDSVGTSVTNVLAESGASGVDDVGSTQTTVWNDASDLYPSVAVQVLSSSHGTYRWINASAGAVGVYAGGYFGSSYYSLPGATTATVNELNSTAGAVGAVLYESNGVSFSHVSSDGFLGSTEGVVGLYVTNVTVTDLSVSHGTDPGAGFVYATGITVTNAFANDSLGVVTIDSDSVVVTGVTAVSSALGAGFEVTTGVTVTNASADSGTGVELEVCPGPSAVTGVTATNAAYGVLTLDSAQVTVTGVTASTRSLGVLADPSTNVTLSGVTATGFAAGTEVVGSSSVTISGTSASNLSEGDYIDASTRVTDTGARATDRSVAVIVANSSFTTVTGTTASNTTQSDVYSTIATLRLPLAAVVTENTTTTTISNVTATKYGAAVYDVQSNGLQVSDVNATAGQYAVVLNGTFNSYLNGVGAYQDWIGLVLQGGVYADDNVVSSSSFVDDTSFGVAILAGANNTLTGNNFVGDNGATTTYSAAHIQAWSDNSNHFSTCNNSTCTAGVGNYWSDWHTYGANGYLAPYFVTGTTWDYFPLGPQEMFEVNFNATGLPSGTTWSVTLGGVTQSSSGPTVTFAEPMGTYGYGVGALGGWTSSPSNGSVTVTGATYNVSVTFSALLYPVTLSAGGLAASTVWSATVNGVTQSTPGGSVVFYLPSGTYPYAFHSVSGYNLPTRGAGGSLTVAGAPLSVAATYTPSSTPSLVSTSTYDTGIAIAIALAAAALVLALIALFWRRQKKEPPSSPPAAWTPPAGSTGVNEAPTTGGPSPEWSEGPSEPPS